MNTISVFYWVCVVGSPPNQVESEFAQGNLLFQTELDPLVKEMSDAAGELEKADTVAIVGGGPVGTELAGEIRDTYKVIRQDKTRKLAE